MNEAGRTLILVLGSRPCDATEFINRSLTIKSVTPEELDDGLLNKARGVIVSEFPGKLRVASEFFSGTFRRACELGLLTLSHSTADWDREYFVTLRDKACRTLDPTDTERFVSLAQTGDSLHNIAERLARHRPGPGVGGVIIETLDRRLKLDAATECLLQRAFWDCDKIVVEQLAGGKTAKDTFRVFASLGGAVHGPQPMPFFVKVGSDATIRKERNHYRLFAEPFIPFHLRPSLNEERCVTGLATSALVCNFVESALSLRIAWRHRQGAGTIFSLFEVTLRGLRSHTARTEKQLGVLEAFLNKRVRAAEIRTEPHGLARIKRAKELGLKQEPEAIQGLLLARAKSIETRRGTFHGDLHCGNVMVRNRDAIVIDFGSMDEFGPLTADPAVLEVSLVFGTDDDDDPDGFEEWKSFVDEVFLNSSPLSPPIPDAEHMRFAWLRRAVRELRHVGACCGITPDEATIVLSGCLLRYARLSVLEFRDPKLVRLSEDRRAYAMVIAEALTAELSRAKS